MKLSTLLLLIYFLSPVDLLPDYHIKPSGLGYIDDLLILCVYLYFNKPFFTKFINQIFFNHKKNKTWKNHDFSDSSDNCRYDEQNNTKKENQTPDEQDKSPYEILAVNENATQDEIREAYRKKCLQYHPDKVAHLGEKLQKVALEEFQKIEKAYHTLKEN